MLIKHKTKEVGLWILKKVSDHLIAAVVTGVLSVSALVSYITIGYQKTLAFLLSSYGVPVWVTVGCSISIVVFIALLINKTRALRAMERGLPLQNQKFMFAGLEWSLTENFLLNYDSLYTKDISAGFLETAVRGPSCPKCKKDANESFYKDKCIYCSEPFAVKALLKRFLDAGLSIPVSLDRQFEFVRKEVYREAQAEYRKK